MLGNTPEQVDAFVEIILDWAQTAPEDRARRRENLLDLSRAAFFETLAMARRRAVLETVRDELAKHGLEGFI